MVDRICERPRWRFDESDDPLMAQVVAAKRMRVLERAVRWVSVAAVHAARKGDDSLALRRLRQGFQLSAAAADEPSSTSFTAFVHCVSFAFEGLGQVLQDLPPNQDLAWVTQEIGAMDARAMLQRAVAGDRYASLELYRRGAVSQLIVRSFMSEFLDANSAYATGRELQPSLGARQAWLYSLVAGHDAAQFVELSEDVLDWLDGSLAETTRVVADLAKHWGTVPWYAPTAQYVASLLTRGVAPCIDLESRLRLARIALADREQGRDTAMQLLERTLDPADDEPIGQRSEDDGSVVLWCIGSDLIDMDGSPVDGDIVCILPPR